MKVALGIVVSLALAAGPSLAQTGPSSTCSGVNDRLEEIQMDLSANEAEGAGDDSAPRATMRAAQDTAHYVEIEVLLRQAEQAKCPPYPAPLGSRRYSHNAILCATARRVLRAGSDLHECERSKWAPNAGLRSAGSTPAPGP